MASVYILYSLSAYECFICMCNCFGFLHQVSLMARMCTLVRGFELYSLSRVSMALNLGCSAVYGFVFVWNGGIQFVCLLSSLW